MPGDDDIDNDLMGYAVLHPSYKAVDKAYVTV